jgi:pyruvate ferredoxin oxidoreductase alpha subunit
MSACIGASASGARVMTGTSSQGLAYMWEMLYIASGLRLPIIMAVVNRTLSSPINIHCDHSDTFGARDCGWIQIYSENVQETYDNLIQAVRIAEHPDVLLPCMVMTDGFILSHCLETLEILSDEEVREFVGNPPERENLIKSAIENKPITIGALDLQDYYFEHKRQQAEAMRNALKIIPEIGKEFGDKFGRYYGFVENYKISDADIGIVVIGSTAGTAKEVVDRLRKKGIKAGLLKIRVYRPFPFEEIRNLLKDLKVVGIMERVEGMNGFFSPLYSEISASLYDFEKRPVLVNFVYGLGGRDVRIEDIEEIFNHLLKIYETGKKEFVLKYIGVRE